MQRSWCQKCQQWETEAIWEKRHVRPLSPQELERIDRIYALPGTRGEPGIVGTKGKGLPDKGIVAPTRPSPRPESATKPQARPELSALAERIRQLRKTRGLSQSALAELLGVAPLAVKRWEAGKMQPRQKIFKRLEELERG